MKKFVELFKALDQTTKTNRKIEALVRFFESASDKDILWAIALFSNRRPRRTIKLNMLRAWAAEIADIPPWLFEESYHVVGDLAETISLVLPDEKNSSETSLSQWMSYIVELKDKNEEEKKAFILESWKKQNADERFLFCKLITGGFRLGVSQKTIVKALARYAGKEENIIAHRLMGNWSPDTVDYKRLILADNLADDLSKPYPFYLAYPLAQEPHTLGNISDWLIEWKWDGIRGQLIKRQGQHFIWSRGEELVTEKYPEFYFVKDSESMDFVLDGEILPYKDDVPLNFHELQTRIGRKNLSRKLLEKTPVVFMAFDLLEWDLRDLRSVPLKERRSKLTQLYTRFLKDTSIRLSPVINFDSWEMAIEKRKKSRHYGTEGFMLKLQKSSYQTGRKKGEWWKWKIDPMTIDAIMIYAMRGHGRRSNLYTDFTFAVWDEQKLVPFAKAYSGLTDAEFREINSYIQRNTIDRFGPVRAIKPELVFELAFEGINASKRHKSGIAVRFPRINRWRKDKHPKEANRLEDLFKLLKDHPARIPPENR